MNSIESMSPRLLRNLIQAASTGIVITDATRDDNPIVFANDAFYIMTGYGPDETIGFNCRFLQGADNSQQEVKVLRNAVKTGSHCKVVLRNYKKDGTAFWNELYVSPYFDELGRLSNFIGIQHDVTDAVELRFKKSVVVEGADQWKAPLPEQAKILEHFDKQSRQLITRGGVPQASLTNLKGSIKEVIGALNFHKMANELVVPRLKVVQASVLIQSAIAELKIQVMGKEIQLRIIQSDGDYHFLADRSMSQLALKNLVDNAINYSQPGKNIWIFSCANEFATMIAVIDEGSGLPEAVKAQMPAANVMHKSDYDETPGAGFGLMTAAQIMKTHNGELNLVKSDYKGSAFALVFPRQTSHILDNQNELLQPSTHEGRLA